MRKVVAIMIASLMFFWAQPSTALVVASAGMVNVAHALVLAPAQAGAGTAATRSTPGNVPPRRAEERAHGPATYGLLALGLLAVALRRQQLMQRWPV